MEWMLPLLYLILRKMKLLFQEHSDHWYTCAKTQLLKSKEVDIPLAYSMFHTRSFQPSNWIFKLAINFIYSQTDTMINLEVQMTKNSLVGVYTNYFWMAIIQRL